MLVTSRSAFIRMICCRNHITPASCITHGNDECLLRADVSGKIRLQSIYKLGGIHMSQPAPQVDLQNIWRLMTGFQASAAFRAAIELELFTKISEGNNTAAEIAAATGAAERGVRILADVLTVLGLLTKSGNEYSLTADSAFFLDKNAPAYVG